MPPDNMPRSLWDPRVTAPDADRSPVTGAMASYVGPQYTADQIWGFYRVHADVYPDEEANLRPLAQRIRAFDVPMLKDATFTAERLGGVVPALQMLLLERLPGTAWDLSSIESPFEVIKYHIIHLIAPAPMDETTQEPMVLEVFGHLTQLNGAALQRHQLMKWFEALTPQEKANLDDLVIGEMTFRIERASYANTAIPGIGVPFYM